ncbi:MAG: preprotein translocase subunit SecE [Deltaproteobacteria bacterium]|nr:preprotein translocase subunit SecE [Deltaproteobacteria bacterium]
MDSNRKWITIGLILLVMVSYWFLGHAFQGAWQLARLREILVVGPVDLPTSIAVVLSLGLGFFLFRNRKFNEWSNEVASEMKKVTWPSLQETRASSIVVILVTFILAFFLGFFDLVWSSVTDLIYGG